MKAGNIAHKVIEAVACNSSCSIKVNAVEPFHNIGMIRDFKIGNKGLAVFGNLYIFGIIFAYGNRIIDDIGNGHHNLCDLLAQLLFKLFTLSKALGKLGYLCLCFHCFVFFALSHKSTDFF